VDDLVPFARLVEALRPWLDELVIIGGWAHRLHRFHPKAGSPSYQPLRTRDADVAFSLQSQLEGNIAAALKKSDFQEDLSGEHVPPISQYRLGDEDGGFYAEFLAPLQGGGIRRDGTPDATIAKAGVTAQKLRHLDLLLIRPWSVRLEPKSGMPLKKSAIIRLANPVCFIAQKLLIQEERTPEKQAQDALYIHDTLELFAGDLDSLMVEWREHIRPALAPKIASNVDRLRRKQFGTVTDVVRSAARIPQDRTITPERLLATCSYGLEEILGTGR
jgi:hypothetical protein